MNLESTFIKEFRSAVKPAGYKDIYKIPLPAECKDWYISGTELYSIKDIEEPYFEKLNRTMVKRLPRDKKAQRRQINPVSRSFARDDEGNYIYEDVQIPTGSIVVLSDIRIGLPHEKKHKPSDGFGYIDFVMSKDTYEYMYIIPKSYLYRVHQTALAMSVKNMKNYEGSGYVTWENGTIFLHIIPYSPNSAYTGTKILKTAYSLNFGTEIKLLLNYWQQIGLIPNIQLCELQDGTNLVLKPTIVGYEDYEPVDTLPINDKETYTGEDV